jgi:hypothetical protein
MCCLHVAQLPTARFHLLLCDSSSTLAASQARHAVRKHCTALLDVAVQVPEVRQKVQELRAKLPGVDVDALISQEPMLLRADLPRLMSELARLMPNADPVRLIASDPQMVLDMDVAGMPSTLELEGVGLEQQ